jgi:2-oxoisovalerate dehydrogenase E1 component subunit alpha
VQHQLPVVFICEQDCSQTSPLHSLSLPDRLEHQCIDGADVMAVYQAMQAAMQHARDGHGPVLLEMRVMRSMPGQPVVSLDDPLLRCQQLLKERGMWDEEWATRLYARVQTEVEQAMQGALRD